MFSRVVFLRRVLPLAAMALMVFALAASARADTVTPLVSTGWLKQHLNDADVVVLDIRSAIDGGDAAWAAEHNAVEAGASKPSPKIFTATLNKALFVDAREVEAIERDGGATLVDARPASFFAGREKAPAAQGYGHIPGAVSLD